MKSVGNLTEFVRENMLQAADTERRIAELIRHFEDLNRSHEAVLKARAQIEALVPVVNDADDYASRSAQVEQLRGCRDALIPWFASLKIELLERRLEDLAREQARMGNKVEELKRRRTQQRQQRDELRSEEHTSELQSRGH